jgi:hypothetical protein
VNHTTPYVAEPNVNHYPVTAMSSTAGTRHGEGSAAASGHHNSSGLTSSIGLQYAHREMFSLTVDVTAH